jgi:hypothetical protein
MLLVITHVGRQKKSPFFCGHRTDSRNRFYFLLVKFYEEDMSLSFYYPMMFLFSKLSYQKWQKSITMQGTWKVSVSVVMPGLVRNRKAQGENLNPGSNEIVHMYQTTVVCSSVLLVCTRLVCTYMLFNYFK